VPNHPFRFEILPGTFLRRAASSAARPLLSWVLRAEVLSQLYDLVDHASPERFVDRSLQLLDISVTVPAADLAHIPTTGSLIVVSNHPHGAVDGLALASTVGRVRRDVRVLANHLLARIPELQSLCFFVDPFAGPAAEARSRAGLRAAHLWLKRGGALVVFPAGEVAPRRTPDNRPVDSTWRDTVGRLALHTGASVVPAFIDGANSAAFYAAGLVHPALRTLLLSRELLNKRGEPLSMRLGESMSPRELAAGDADAGEVTRRLRLAADQLASPTPGAMALTSTQPQLRAESETETREILSAEISHLPSGSCLVDAGSFQVFCAPAAIIPHMLQEIGRLRAVTYREAGEGVDSALDLDAFDQHYLHLFTWDRAQRQVVGAYRIGRSDCILKDHGTDGLYTRSLFRYDNRFIDTLSPALELGRSFVRAEYQRSHAALLLLWKGIGRFVALHPEYRVLFGPVSISSRYSDASQKLLKAFLEQNHLDRSASELVEALHPLTPRTPAMPVRTVTPQNIDEADRLVSQMEADGKGMPVLLRQYLKLNARLIGFSVDPEFGDVVDALMAVELPDVDPAILTRYLGRHDAGRYLARHNSVRSVRLRPSRDERRHVLGTPAEIPSL